MKKTEKLSRWLLILLVFYALLFLYCLFFAREILIEEGLFLVLGLFTIIVLTDLLLTWVILLSFAFGIVSLVAGVVYIPFNQALLLLFSFPVLLGILSQIRYHLFKEIAKVQDQEPDAYVDYRNRIAAYSSQSNDRIQALLIHWSHEELFFQMQPREYNRTLNQIHYLLSNHIKQNGSLYYVSDGNFLLFDSTSQTNLKDEYETVVKPQLESLVFRGEDGVQAIQFQSGFLAVDPTNRTKYYRYKEMMSYLKRQLETDIIVEY